MACERCSDLRVWRTLRGIALALTCVAAFACGTDPVAAPPSGDDDDEQEEVAPATTDGGKSSGRTGDAAPDDSDDGTEESEPAGPAGGTDGGSSNKPKPLLDASTSSSDGGVPFDPIPGEPDAGVARVDLGVGDGKDVVTIGDSWMNMFTNGGGIEGALRRAGKRYRNYGVAGTTLSGQIPGQYSSAKRAGSDIKTVIMTGGGNDIMFSGACNSSAERCEDAGEMIVKRLNTLWTQMANDGVKDVVYIQYASSAGTARMRPEGGANSADAATRAVVEVCTTGKIRCHSIPTSDLVSSRDLPDGIHPNQSANDRIAKRILETMEMRGVRR